MYMLLENPSTFCYHFLPFSSIIAFDLKGAFYLSQPRDLSLLTDA